MTNPVHRSSARPLSYYEALSEGASLTFADSVPIQEPPVERVTHSKANTLKALGGVAMHVGKHALAHKLARSTNATFRVIGSRVLGPVAVLWLMYDVFKLISGPPSMSDNQKARVREQFSQATVLMARDALPREYVQARVTHEAAAMARLQDAMDLLRIRLGSAEEADTAMVMFQKQVEQFAFQGMEFAAAYDLRSPKALDALLARDASFRDRFQSDLAFQEGVRAMVWLGQNQPAEFEARLSLFASQKATVTGALARPLQ
ncbi:MAG: hypothetical protein RMJ98_19500 [Myxococcales bacterium]|nr:hypothetical protein [Polyangiaceae bacterium]MDW8251486.1 hypothetical protein [Myxococcales bacterium]